MIVGKTKKFLIITCAIIMILLLSTYNNGNTDQVKVTIGDSKKFSKTEIQSAVDCVLKKFKNYDGRTLTDLWYEEGRSNLMVDGYMSNGRGSVNGVKKSNVIVLLSNFKVDSSGPNIGFNSNSIVSGWNWILIRDDKSGSWKVDDSGY